VLARIERAGPVFAWGEDDRLAAVLVSLARRGDFDPAPVYRWMSQVPPAWKALWETPALDTGAFARLTNARHVLRSLHFALTASDQPPAARTMADRARATLARLE
jgi:hypothetical protein